MNWNALTFWLFVGFWPLWLVWEVVLLVMRGEGMNVGLISMVAKDRAYQMNAIPFTWCGLAAHFWLNWYSTKTWTFAVPMVLFWSLVAGTFVLDLVLWNRPYATLPSVLRAYRWPGVQVGVGMLAGYLLFPQRGISP